MPDHGFVDLTLSDEEAPISTPKHRTHVSSKKPAHFKIRGGDGSQTSPLHLDDLSRPKQTDQRPTPSLSKPGEHRHQNPAQTPVGSSGTGVLSPALNEMPANVSQIGQHSKVIPTKSHEHPLLAPGLLKGTHGRSPFTDSQPSKAALPRLGPSPMNRNEVTVRPTKPLVSSPLGRKQMPIMNPSAALKQIALSSSSRVVQAKSDIVSAVPIGCVPVERPAFNQWEPCLSCLRIGATCDGERPCQSCEATECVYASDAKNAEVVAVDRLEPPIQKEPAEAIVDKPIIGLFATIKAEEETDSEVEDEEAPTRLMENIDDLESMLTELQQKIHLFQEYTVRPLLQQSRIDSIRRGNDPQLLLRTSPFDLMGPKQATSSLTAPKLQLRVTDYSQYAHSIKQKEKVIAAPITNVPNSLTHLPRYKSIGRLHSSVLARNVTIAKHNFYGVDDEVATWDEIKDKYAELEERYHSYDSNSAMLHAQRDCAEMTNLWQPWFNEMMDHAGSSWQDMLRFYTQDRASAQTENLKLTDSQLAQWLEEQESNCGNCSTQHTPENERHLISPWNQILASLQQTGVVDQDRPTDLSSTGLLCAIFHKVHGFSLWHLISTDSRAEATLRKVTRALNSKNLGQQMCVVCALHNCSIHGAYNEDPDMNVADELDDIHVNDDEADRNARLNVSLPIRSQIESPKPAQKQGRRKKTLPVRKSKTSMGNNKNLEAREVFVPCSHAGACQENPLCSCFKAQIACEHSCNCNDACSRRFKGCKCAAGPERVCHNDHTCECWNASRECDPWLCKSCGVLEVLDQANKYNEDIRKGRCYNSRCQLGIPARTIKAPSEVQGYGLFTGESLREGDFIGEYKGEIISKPESDRRGGMYSLLGAEYLFNLNAGQLLDASNFGNKTRFMNNSSLVQNINVSGCVMLCSGVHRIMLYAKRNIKAGEELLFNYEYPVETHKHFWERGEESSNKKAALRLKDPVSKTVSKPQAKEEAWTRPRGFGGRFEKAVDRGSEDEIPGSSQSPVVKGTVKRKYAAMEQEVNGVEDSDYSASEIEVSESGESAIDSDVDGSDSSGRPLGRVNMNGTIDGRFGGASQRKAHKTRMMRQGLK